MFDNNVAVILPKKGEYLGPVWAFCSSEQFHRQVRLIDEKLGVTNATMVKVPFNIQEWREEFERRYPKGLPEVSSCCPDEWIFDGHPSSTGLALHVAIARLLGFVWPRQNGRSFVELSDLDRDNLERQAVDDGIVCLQASRGKLPAEQQLNVLLSQAFGENWSAAKLVRLLADVGSSGGTLEDWLRDEFFQQHCEVFHQRPFIWHIWDGRRDGFNALVNYHRLSAPGGDGRRTLERLIYTYLGDWIDRQRDDQKASVEGADGRLAAAEHLRSELINILEGEPPYDIFVRWKPLSKQPIGWQPDINDGVRINIRPFMTAHPLKGRSANACILRTTPKIRWEKDRGKEPDRDKNEYPWFWGWDEEAQDFTGGKTFDGNRWNDLHYSRAFKEAARDQKKKNK
jgi:hypothetical protein